MNKIIFFAVLFYGFFGLAESSSAATYHVRTDGHDTASGFNNTTDETTGALQHIQNCISAHATSPGDTCIVHAGDYTSEGRIITVTDGSPGNVITIQGGNGEIVLIANFTISHQYNSFSNFTITNPKRGLDGNTAAIILSAPNVTASNMIVSGCTSTDGCNCLSNQGAQGVTFNGTADATSIIENSMFGGEAEQYFHLVFIMHRPGTIRNNIIKNLSDTERIWDVTPNSTSNSNGAIISGNEIYNFLDNGHFCDGNHPDIFQSVSSGSNSGAAWTIQNNYFHDSGASMCDIDTAAVLTGWIWHNNVFANISGGFACSFPSAKIQNNTFFQTGQSTTAVISYAAGRNVEVTNNILIGASVPTTQGMLGYPTPDIVDLVNYNFYSLPMDSGYTARDTTIFNAIKGIGSINGGDPKFVAAYNDCVVNSCNFNLQASSPLINMGSALNEFFIDKDEISRPQGSAWDIGAYEYVPPPDTTPPAAPTGLAVL